VKIVIFYFDLSFCVAQKKLFTLLVATSRVNKKIKTRCAIVTNSATTGARDQAQV